MADFKQTSLNFMSFFQKLVQARPRSKARSGRVLTVEIGSSWLKMAEFERQNSKLALTRFAARELPLRSDPDPLPALKELVKEVSPTLPYAFTSLSGPSVAVRYIQLPKMTSHEVTQAIQYEAGKYIPFKSEDVYLDSQILDSEADQKMRTLVVGAKKEAVQKLLALFKGVGLEVKLIDVDAFCLINAFWDTQKKSSGTIALIDMGASYTNVNILRDGVIAFTRDVPLGGVNVTRLISQSMGLDLTEAELVKCHPEDQLNQIKEIQQPFFESFLKEIRLSFDYYENQFEKDIDRVYLGGASRELSGLMSYLQEGLHLTIESWDPLQDVLLGPQLDQKEIDAWRSSLGVCRGLALRNL
jgi:type IV pilus assembly protein PilM